MKNWQISSTRNQPDKKIVYTALFILLPLSALLSICCGSVRISLPQVLRALLGLPCDTVQANIILLARLPRTCGCLLAGMALAVSGAVIQSVLSDPLAAPNVIGVNSGAGMAVALCSALAPTAAALVPAAAFIGALASVLLVLFISEKTGASKITLVLSGIAVSGIFSALIDAVVTFVPDALNGYTDFRIGGFSNLAMSRLSPAVWMILIAFAAILSLTNELDILMLGSETASGLGLNVKVYRVLLLTLCDLGARVIFAPFELPVGIVLSLLGGPFFIWLLLRQRGGRIRD